MKRQHKSQFKLASIFKPKKSKYWLINWAKLKTWLLFLLSLGLIVSLVVGLRSSIFQVQTISCFKNSFPCSQKEYQSLENLRTKNIFFTDFNNFKAGFLAANSQIASLVINKRLPNQLEINLIPRQAGFLVTTNQLDWFLIDDQGVILGQVSDLVQLPKITFPASYQLTIGQQLNSDCSLAALTLAQTLKDFFINFQQIKVEFPNIFIVQIDSGQAIFSSNKDFKAQVASLQLILSRSRIEGKIPEKIDFRFDKPIISFN